MYQTIQLSSCVSVQGRIVEDLGNGEVVIRNGRYLYRGRPVTALQRSPLPSTGSEAAASLRPQTS